MYTLLLAKKVRHSGKRFARFIFRFPTYKVSSYRFLLVNSQLVDQISYRFQLFLVRLQVNLALVVNERCECVKAKIVFERQVMNVETL